MIEAAATICATLALTDERLLWLEAVAIALGVVAMRRVGRPWALLFALSAGALLIGGVDTGADSLDYFVYSSSLLFDFDLDFGNQRASLGIPMGDATPTGHRANVMPIGPGLLWLPFVAFAHGFLLLSGGRADGLGLSAPYFDAASAASVGLALLGARVLHQELSKRFDRDAATLAVATSVLASPLLYYVARQPLMSHAVAFGAAALVAGLSMRAEASARRGDWLLCGVAFGVMLLMRTQSIAVLPFVLACAVRGRASARNLVAAAAVAALCFAPQTLAWRALYGSFLTIPQGRGFIEWNGDHAFDVLFSADRGLFNWHPLQLGGLAGLVLAARRYPGHAAAGCVVLALTTFINGSVRDWNASAAFGARRFDIVLPILAFGTAALVASVRSLVAARPVLVPSLVVLAGFAWNASLIDIVKGTPGVPLPLDDVARRQVESLHKVADRVAGWSGPRAQSWVYRAFVGRFAYESDWAGGDLELATLDARFLRHGWSDRAAWDDGVIFRYLLFPEACLVIPIDEPFDLRGSVLARSPRRIAHQQLTVVLNDVALRTTDLPHEWTEVPFDAPKHRWRPGENLFCLRAASKRPGDEGDDLSFAAAVVRVQLP